MSVDPLQTLQAALTAPANSNAQAELLSSLRESLEAHPAPIPILVGTLIAIVVNAGDSLLKRWVIDLLQFAICRSSLALEARTQLASQSLDTLAQLVNDPNPAIVKLSIQCLTTVYPLLFRLMCTNRSNPAAWDTLLRAKNSILDFVWAPNVSVGVRVSAVKFLQRVILVQTRGVSDPRLQNKNDPNISFCPADHPFISVSKLEAEGQHLLEVVRSVLYTSQNVDLLSAMLNSWASLVKLRPSTIPMIVAALRQWTPNALVGQPASSIKSIEKAIRILLIHMSRLPVASQYAGQINEALAQQGVRMDKAAMEEKKRKALAAAGTDNRKRPLSAPTEDSNDAKRPKLEETTASTSVAFLAGFDFTQLPATLITDLIVANLQAFSEPDLINLVQAYRRSRGISTTVAPPPETAQPPSKLIAAPTPAAPQPALGQLTRLPPPASSTPSLPSPSVPAVLSAAPAQSAPPPTQPKIKDEPVDPLQMDIDEEEMEYEPDRLNLELSGDIAGTGDDPMAIDVDPSGVTHLKLIDFKLPPPKELYEEERMQLLRSASIRIWSSAEDVKAGGETLVESSSNVVELWMLLLVRMVTRVAEPPPEDEAGNADDSEDFYMRQDRLRQLLCDHIITDFPSRVRLATTWMNEEWYNDQLRLKTDLDWRPNYDIWLNQLVVSYQTLKTQDKTFPRFLLDLPSVPSDVLILLRDLCVDPEVERQTIGFTALREFVRQRPSLRLESLNILLELTTHHDRLTRGAAIKTVRTWVPNMQPMDSIVREFALQMLRKLQLRHPPESKSVDTVMKDGDKNGPDETGKDEKTQDENGHDENMEDGQLPPEDLVQTPYLPERIELPADKSHVLQHVELLFALCMKVPDFLDEIFAAYGQMDVTVQEAIQELITALIRSLGSSHGKLLTLMRTCPPGAESLALRVLTIFTEHGRPSHQLVALVKALINERDLDARFLIPIIAEMDKPDIIKYLPRIVSILNGQAEPKNLVRSVFGSVVTTPPQTFGSVTSNMPRVRQSELLTPAELMVLLHDSEKEIGLKSAIEAIGICFSMTDVFRSEILAVVMQQIMDEPVLPVLFLRTVIQAVTTYKSLVGFVSTTLLSRLITKKIWTNPPLWEGFIRCAKVIAPASFGALLQLPKEQLRELVDKQPSLKSGLRDYVTKKAGNKARAVAGFLDIFGEDDSNAVSTPPPGQAELAVSSA